jgi:hypothetical protein
MNRMEITLDDALALAGTNVAWKLIMIGRHDLRFNDTELSLVRPINT